MVENRENNLALCKVNHGTFVYIAGFFLLIVSVLFVSSVVNAIIIITSYIGGFVFCYLVLRFKCQCLKCVSLLLSYFGLRQCSEKIEFPESPKFGCSVCGGSGCSRHLESTEPWESLHIHKQLDQAVEDFYNIILTKFVSEWYSKLTKEHSFLIELRFLLRFSSSSLLKRGLKVNIGELISNKLVPCALGHYAVCMDARQLMESKGCSSLQEAALEGPLRYSLHPAVANRETELEYLKSVTRAIMPYLLPKEDLESKLLNILLREIFAGWVLLSLTDILSDPGIINTLVILATSDIKLSKLPEFPKHQVEFLANFVDCDNYKRLRLLNVDVAEIIKNREYLYAFMQFLKSVGKIHLLQFCMDIDEFNKKMLKPDLTPDEEVTLFNNAWDIYLMYFVRESPSFISFSSENVDQFKTILGEGTSNITKLQTSKALFQAYDHVYTALDSVWAPKFFDTDNFYRIVFGLRPSKDYVKKDLNKKNDKTSVNKPGNLVSKTKGSLKSEVVDGQIMESAEGVMRISSDGDLMDGTDVDLQYSDVLTDYAKLKERDLTTWRVSIEDIKEKQAASKTSIKHFFTISILKTDPLSLGNEAGWTVDRSDNDFHTLKAKLVEFHGEVEMGDANMPSKRVKAAAEVRKKKYEVFLQNLLLKPLLRSSDLLHLFLTADDDFASLAEQARPGFSIVPDLGNIYQTVTHKLRKEKGQHLDAFMTTYLISTDVDYYQAQKEDSRDIDNGEEATDLLSIASCSTAESNLGRCITASVFGNNFNLQNKQDISLKKKHFKTTGFTQVLSILLTDVFRVRKFVVGISETILNLGPSNVDETFDNFLTDLLCTVLSPPRLAHLIKLGQEILFEDAEPSTKKADPSEKRATAKSQLQNAFPYFLTSALGPNFLSGVDDLFEFLQNPLLNKQLIYNLLDIILAELFPELENVT